MAYRAGNMAFRTRTRWLFGTYGVCFGIGAFNHARDFLARGWRPYAAAPPGVEAFWTALIVLDLGVVALILGGRHRAALLLAAAVMTADVAVNTWVSRALEFGLGPALQLQTLFLGFILGSLPFAWSMRGLGRAAGKA